MSSSNCASCGHATTAAPTKEKKERKPRAPSAYNTFFKDQMATPEVKAMAHKERMAYISSKWNQQKAAVAPAAASQGQAQAQAQSDALPAGRPALVRSL